MLSFLSKVIKKSGPKNAEAEMGFLDHIEELRWYVIRSVIFILVISIIALINQKWIFQNIIFAPKNADFITYKLLCKFSSSVCFTPPELQLITRELGEQFFTGITVCLYLGLIVSFPFVFYQFWSFVKPGLYDNEKKVAGGLVGITALLFFLGVLFGYFVIAPFSIAYLGSYTLGVDAINSPTLASYVSYLTMFTLPTGLAFELPIIVYFLGKIGLIGPATMRKFRREAYLVILVVAAIITPPDVVSQILVSLPLFVLYEISISIVKRIEKENNTLKLNEPQKLPEKSI
jgi:sec-independent protein translocase protein TatC